MSLRVSSISWALSLTLVPLAAASCYNLDHSLVASPDYQPCNSIQGTFSMCCATNRTIASGAYSPSGGTRDNCLPNGLCQMVYRDDNNDYQFEYWRESCSSPDWTGCLSYVCNSTDTGKKGDIRMTPCADTYNTTRWCCSANGNNSDCCSNWDNHPDRVSIPLTLAQSATSTSSSAQTPTVLPASPPHRGDLSTGAKAGIGVGAALGGMLLFGLGFMVASMMRRRKMAAGYKVQEQEVQGQQYGGLLAYNGPYGPPGTHQTQELPSSRPLVEMPSK